MIYNPKFWGDLRRGVILKPFYNIPIYPVIRVQLLFFCPITTKYSILPLVPIDAVFALRR